MTDYPEANELLVTTWIRYQQFGSLFDREVDYWAVIKLDEICKRDPTEAFKLIVEILQRHPSALVIESLIDGPMQELTTHHGEAINPHIDRLAKDNPEFALMLRRRQA